MCVHVKNVCVCLHACFWVFVCVLCVCLVCVCQCVRGVYVCGSVHSVCVCRMWVCVVCVGVHVACCVSVRVSVVSLCAPKHVLTKGCLGLVCVLCVWVCAGGRVRVCVSVCVV